jgi:Tfp pilus assembly protein PilP
MRTLTFALIAPVVLAAGLHAQTQPSGAKPQTPPPQQAPPPQTAPPPAEKPAPPPPQENYSYKPEGRRDPFLNLLGSGSEPRTAGGKRADGASSMTTAEISVRGILQSRGSLVAMISGPDGKTYIVHQGDKLADGVIKTITPQGLVVIQEVNDPLSLVKQREVTKLLRALEVAK